MKSVDLLRTFITINIMYYNKLLDFPCFCIYCLHLNVEYLFSHPVDCKKRKNIGFHAIFSRIKDSVTRNHTFAFVALLFNFLELKAEFFFVALGT